MCVFRTVMSILDFAKRPAYAWVEVEHPISPIIPIPPILKHKANTPRRSAPPLSRGELAKHKANTPRRSAPPLSRGELTNPYLISKCNL